MRKIKFITSSLLALCMILSFSFAALAATPSTAAITTNNIISPNGLADHPPTVGWAGYVYVTAEPSLALRSSASTSSSIKLYIPYGTLIYDNETYSNGWSYVKYNYNGQYWYGYCQSAYLNQYEY